MRAVRVKSLVYTRRVSMSANAQRGKNDVNIEEIITDVGICFHAKVKVSFLKPEKHGHRQPV